MRRCCDGETYVEDNSLPGAREESWVVKCLDCGTVLAIKDCPREEVYYSL